jgi:hypothetical protein
MGPAILDSARKHGVADEDMLHAYRNPVYVIVDDDDDFTLHIGGDRSGNLIEVGTVEAEDSTVVIIHAMPARLHKLR